MKNLFYRKERKAGATTARTRVTATGMGIKKYEAQRIEPPFQP